jgi:diaminohydroxyphosphoribosylaminopyrimidine deaminase/5-amino-6-(5-phosphoribosylamino)uracil reductase
LTRLLVEGGRRLATSLLAAELVDRLCWFRAPALIGDDGLAALGELGVARIADLRRFHRVSAEPVGDDLLETYALRP